MGLGFLAPAFLAGVLAVAIPIALHLYRRRSDTVVDFPAMQMLPEAPVERQERRRLRDLLLLALRAAALVLLAVSFARPYFVAGGAPLATPATVVALDRSLSLGAPGQWDDAVRLAQAAVADAPATHLVGVVAFDDRADLLVAPTVDRAAARAALADVRPGAGGTRFGPALARATEALAPNGGRIVVVTDLQARGWSDAEPTPTPDGIEVVVETVASPPGNLAVTAARLQDGVLTAVVQSFAPGPRTATVHAAVGGREMATARIELGPHASADVRFDAAWPATGTVEIAVDDQEGYAADNRRFVALDRGTPARVVVLTAEPPESATTGLYVQRALEAAPPGAGADVVVVDGRRLDLDPPPEALIVVGTRTLDRARRAVVARYLADGGRVWLSLGPDVDVPTLAELVGVPIRLAPEPVTASGEEAALVPADRRHPMLRRLTGTAPALGRLPIERYRRVLDEAGWDVLARFAGGSMALAERRVGDGVLVLFTSDLDNRWNRFPLEPSFAPFVVETARYLTGDATARAVFTLPDVPAGVPAAPGGHVWQTPAGARSVVVNVDPAESDPAAMDAETFLARVPRVAASPAARAAADARVQEDAQRLWQIGLLVMLAVLALESLLGRGRRAAQPRSPGLG
ncbi:MAG: BatA domain-containing protein [Vicinamibacterales bacterium]